MGISKSKEWSFIMAKQKKPVHRVQMTEGKRSFIHQLMEEYDISGARSMENWQSCMKAVSRNNLKTGIKTGEKERLLLTFL